MHESVLSEPRHGGFSDARSALLIDIEPHHFWFAARQRLLLRLLSRHLNPHSAVLDVGCGSAAVSSRLGASGHRVIGLDRSTRALRAARSRAPALLGLRGDASALPLRTGSIDAALMLDVLEHGDDRLLLRALHRVLMPAAPVLLTVPALPWLWSHRDEAAGHVQRYTRRTLCHLLAETGYEVLHTHYYQCLLLPLLAVTRRIGRRGPALRDIEDRPSRSANLVLGAINRLEVSLGRVVPWPIGSSLVVICRKAA